MNRTITTRRLYRTADYENIEFTDVITDIPEDIWRDEKSAKLVRYLQLVEIEYNFLRYKKLQAKLGKVPKVDELMKLIEEERTRTFDELFKALSKEKEDVSEDLSETVHVEPDDEGDK